MADEIKNAKDGLKTRLETISGLRVYDQSEDAINEFPAALIMLEDINYQQAFGGNDMEVTFQVTLYLTGALPLEQWEDMDNYLSPLGTKSILAAVEGDKTWGSNVAWGLVESVDDIRESIINNARARMADFHIRAYIDA